jgi:hypothetical protein
MMRPSILLTLVFSLCVATHLAAQVNRKHEPATPEKERPASDAHSFLELFTRLERDWIQAAQGRDGAALDSILAPEFTGLSSESPENPLLRADWIQRTLTGCDILSYSHRAMTIRAFLGVAVVSFVQSQKATCDGKDCSGDYLIVDLWETNHNRWQVSARYMAPATDRSASSPIAPK